MGFFKSLGDAATARTAAASGEEVMVALSGMQQVGMVDFDPLIEFEVTVLPERRPPYPAQARQAVSSVQLPRLRPGTTLIGRVNPADQTSVWLDLGSLGR